MTPTAIATPADTRRHPTTERTAGQGFTYTYDDEGNRLTRTETATGKVQSYEWDYRNRLTVVKEQNSSGGAIVKQVNYEYDAFNRLVRRTYDADGAGAGGATNQFWAYDEGINAVLQFDGASASNLAHRYLWSDQVDDLFADEQVTSLSSGGNTLWALSDHLGSIRDIADYNEATGVTTVANHRTLSATGKIVSETTYCLHSRASSSIMPPDCNTICSGGTMRISQNG